MPRALNLRQIEAFKAVVENGTVSRAAEMLNMSQPAMSQLIAHLEMDTGLKLFDRVKGRLAPTEQGMMLFEEVTRIFGGVRQVENAVEAIRRQRQGRLAVGVSPALASFFIQRATASFMKDRSGVLCTVETLNSAWIVERLISRKLDVGLVGSNFENPYMTFEPLMDLPLVCVMPLDHPLAAKDHVEPHDLDQMPFVGFSMDTYTAQRIAEALDKYGVQVHQVAFANEGRTLCEFAAAGLGVALVHPLLASGLEHQLAVRRFEPEIMFNFKLCQSADGRNAQLVEAFAQELRTMAKADWPRLGL